MTKRLATALLASLLGAAAGAARAEPVADGRLVVEAREALRKGDANRLASLRSVVVAADHPLASWVDYWDLSGRLRDATVPEVEAFYTRWRGSYVEDRLRNDWLLELGRRRDWTAFGKDFPHFRMADDREVTCHALMTWHLAGQDVTDAARAAWLAQRDADDGCHLLAQTLVEAGKFSAADVWHKVRLSVEVNRPRAARAAAALAGLSAAQAVHEIVDSPARWLTRKAAAPTPEQRQLALVAVMRMATNDPEAAARHLEQGWSSELPPELAAQAWAQVGKQAALKQLPDALAHYQRAWTLQSRSRKPVAWSDDTLAWCVRAALRAAAPERTRWQLVERAIDAMSVDERKVDPAWTYWKARAVQALADADAHGNERRAVAQMLLESIASPLTFYGKLATEDLGRLIVLPEAPAPLTDAEREAAATHPGLARALQMIALGLRNEGVREWNFSLRGMDDRALLAAAKLACDREVWDRCINTSDRTRNEVDLAQRFPTPFRDEVLAAARGIGLDPAYVYGLIRQESRFVMDARSGVGASGLMQLMPATARWTARKIGLDYRAEMITDRDVNLKLGTSYLKLVLDDFEGSAALAAAAYNAGPSRPRRWREGAPVEPAAWAESIPFNETRDYVKKVLSNATLYGALLRTAAPPALKPRLGAPIGPRESGAAAPNLELP